MGPNFRLKKLELLLWGLKMAPLPSYLNSFPRLVLTLCHGFFKLGTIEQSSSDSQTVKDMCFISNPQQAVVYIFREFADCTCCIGVNLIMFYDKERPTICCGKLETLSSWQRRGNKKQGSKGLFPLFRAKRHWQNNDGLLLLQTEAQKRTRGLLSSWTCCIVLLCIDSKGSMPLRRRKFWFTYESPKMYLSETPRPKSVVWGMEEHK